MTPIGPHRSTAVPAAAGPPSGHSTNRVYLPEPIRITPTTTSVLPRVNQPSIADFQRCYLIQGQLSPQYSLKQALPVRLFIEGAEFVAEQEYLGIHAFGDTVAEAITGLRDEILEHYERLTMLGDHISARLKRERDQLDRVLRAVMHSRDE